MGWNDRYTSHECHVACTTNVQLIMRELTQRLKRITSRRCVLEGHKWRPTVSVSRPLGAISYCEVDVWMRSMKALQSCIITRVSFVLLWGITNSFMSKYRHCSYWTWIINKKAPWREQTRFRITRPGSISHTVFFTHHNSSAFGKLESLRSAHWQRLSSLPAVVNLVIWPSGEREWTAIVLVAVLRV